MKKPRLLKRFPLFFDNPVFPNRKNIGLSVEFVTILVFPHGKDMATDLDSSYSAVQENPQLAGTIRGKFEG
jgi:hypothetical protein